MAGTKFKKSLTANLLNFRKVESPQLRPAPSGGLPLSHEKVAHLFEKLVTSVCILGCVYSFRIFIKNYITLTLHAPTKLSNLHIKKYSK